MQCFKHHGGLLTNYIAFSLRTRFPMTEDCRRLWVAVLEQAIEDIRRDLAYADSSRAWFQSEREGVGSFLWICRMLDIDPGSTRKKVVKTHPGILVRHPEGRSSLGGYSRKLES